MDRPFRTPDQRVGRRATAHVRQVSPRGTCAVERRAGGLHSMRGPLGATQREYGLLIALPRYRARLERALLTRGRTLDERRDSLADEDVQRQSRFPWAA